MMWADGRHGSDSDPDVQALRACLGPTASDADDLSEVQIDAVECAEEKATSEEVTEVGTAERANARQSLNRQPEVSRSAICSKV